VKIPLTECCEWQGIAASWKNKLKAVYNGRRNRKNTGGNLSQYKEMKHNKTSWPGPKQTHSLTSNCQFPACKSFFAWSTAQPATFTNWFIIACCRRASILSRKAKTKLLHRNYKSWIQRDRETRCPNSTKTMTSRFFVYLANAWQKQTLWLVSQKFKQAKGIAIDQSGGRTCWYMIIYSKCAKTWLHNNCRWSTYST
jgi:hypothetical protein